MKINVNRILHTDKSTIGILYVDNVRECYTLEDKEREVVGKPVSEWKVDEVTAIPKGIYNVVINHSPKYNKDMVMIENVEGFSGVRIHSGNVAEDTEGCILVGTTIGDDKVFNSRDAMNALFTKVKTALDKQEKVTITIK